MNAGPPPPARRSTGVVRGILGRFEHLLRELGKFGVVGGLAFIIDLTVFNLLLSPVGWLWAPVISTSVSATAAFLGNRYWTWRDRPRSSLAREYLLYFFFNVVGLGITLAVLFVSHQLLGSIWPDVFHTRLADNVAKMVIGTGFATIFRFWAYRRFVFVAPVPSAVAPAEAAR